MEHDLISMAFYIAQRIYRKKSEESNIGVSFYSNSHSSSERPKSNKMGVNLATHKLLYFSAIPTWKVKKTPNDMSLLYSTLDYKGKYL